jgi:hypothetical protein
MVLHQRVATHHKGLASSSSPSSSPSSSFSSPSYFSSALELVAAVSPRNGRVVCCEAMLSDPSRVYTVLPLSFAFLHTDAKGGGTVGRRGKSVNSVDRPFVLVFYSSKHLRVWPVHMSPETVPRSLQALVLQKSSDTMTLGEHCRVLTLRDGSVCLLLAINHSSQHFRVTCDTSASTGLWSSRGAMITEDHIPPKHRMLVAALSCVDMHVGYLFSFKVEGILELTPGKTLHRPPLRVSDLHTPIPC